MKKTSFNTISKLEGGRGGGIHLVSLQQGSLKTYCVLLRTFRFVQRERIR